MSQALKNQEVNEKIVCWFKVEPGVHSKLKALAAEQKRSLAGQIELLIEKALGVTK